MIKKDNLYYWEHPEEYKRLTADDLKLEPTIYLCEFMLRELRQEMEDVIYHINLLPNDKDTILKTQKMKRDLEQPHIDALAFGHGQELVDELVKRCPIGVFDIVFDKGHGSVARKGRPYPQTNVSSLWNKRETVRTY